MDYFWRIALPMVLCTPIVTVACSPDAHLPTDRAGETEQFEQYLRAYFDALVARDRAAARSLTTEDFVLIENGYPMDLERLTETWDPSKPGLAEYRFEDLQVEVVDSIAYFRYGLSWLEGGEQIASLIETGIARRRGDLWQFVQFHGSWLPIRIATGAPNLTEYTGRYLDSTRDIRVYAEDDKLFYERSAGGSFVAGVRRAELIPIGQDVFAGEFHGLPVRFVRSREGAIVAMRSFGRDGAESVRLPRAIER